MIEKILTRRAESFTKEKGENRVKNRLKNREQLLGIGQQGNMATKQESEAISKSSPPILPPFGDTTDIPPFSPVGIKIHLTSRNSCSTNHPKRVGRIIEVVHIFLDGLIIDADQNGCYYRGIAVTHIKWLLLGLLRAGQVKIP